MAEILGDAVPDELVSAFWAYERALIDDDHELRLGSLRIEQTS